MKNYHTDERTGIRYELVGDYYHPIDFGIKPLPKKAEQEQKATIQENAQADRPVIGRFGRAHAAFLKRTQRHVYTQASSAPTLPKSTSRPMPCWSC